MAKEAINPLLGDEKPTPEALEQMQKSGGSWYAYQNHELGHQDCGHLQFLKVGPGCTFEKPPFRLPDINGRINWRYILVGKVNVEKGEIEDA